MHISRRDVLKMSVTGAAVVALPLARTASASSTSRLAQSQYPTPFEAAFTRPPVARPVRTDATTDYYSLTMRPGTTEIAPGLSTQIWGFNGRAPGPTIVQYRDRPAVVRQINKLPPRHPQLGYLPWTSTHLHGSPSLPQYDGYASDITLPGQYKDYHFPNTLAATTLWYHDHGVMHTGPNDYMGLVAQYQIHDALELALPIPHGRYDVPLIISDVLLAADGSLLWEDNDESGLFGDIILVNGRPWPAMKVERRKYRFRMLNASVSRSYRWQLDSGEPFHIIATDSGLMPSPQPVQQFRHAVAERYEVIIDFAKYPVGQRVIMHNLSNDNNIDYVTTSDVMAFDVVAEATSQANNAIPDSLNPGNPTMALTAADATTNRRFEFVRDGGEWTINGTTWADVVASNFTFTIANPSPDSVELWEFTNDSGGWFHPVHVHLIDYKVISRNGGPPMPHELGPKDTVYLGEGETVQVLIRFKPDERGRYMMHCHNLVHEDHDMMTQFAVGDLGPDPIHTDPARPLPAPRL